MRAFIASRRGQTDSNHAWYRENIVYIYICLQELINYWLFADKTVVFGQVIDVHTQMYTFEYAFKTMSYNFQLYVITSC